MPDVPSSFSSDEQAQVVVEIIPVEEEDDDVDTIAVAGQVTTNLQQEAISLKGYDVKALPGEEHGRGVDVILLITLISTGIVASKDLLTSIFDLLTSVIELLTKRDHVQEIEVIIEGKTFIFRDLSKKTAKELVEDLATRHPEVTQALMAGTKIQAKAKVSKKRRLKN
jgi:hypothetical protein